MSDDVTRNSLHCPVCGNTNLGVTPAASPKFARYRCKAPDCKFR